MFISGRKLDTAFPKIQHLSDDDIAGVETSNVFLATNGSAVLLEEFGTACKLQAAAMRELMSLADEPENPEEAAATEELRAKLLQLESRR